MGLLSKICNRNLKYRVKEVSTFSRGGAVYQFKRLSRIRPWWRTLEASVMRTWLRVIGSSSTYKKGKSDDLIVLNKFLIRLSF